MDAKGKTVIGFTDGCIGPCGADGTPNAFDSYGTIARQSAGLTLLSQFDPPPPTEDVTDSTRFVQSGLTWKTGLSTFKLKIKNVAANALAAPLHVLVAEIQSTSGNVTVANADNGQPGAGATFSYSALLNGDSLLSPNEMSGSRDLSFNNAGKEKFSVTLRVIRGNPASQSMPARDGANSSEVRYLRLSVDPLLGVVNVQLITR